MGAPAGLILAALVSAASAGGLAPRAASSIGYSVDSTSVLEDLEGIDGFSISNYGTEFSFIYLAEVAYSPLDGDGYGLYAYFYQPLTFYGSDSRNRISIGVGGSFSKYSMTYVSGEGRFYKYKISFAGWSGLDSASREYTVSEAELYLGGSNATAYSVGLIYDYTGVAYGVDGYLESTLSVTVTETDVLKLEVGSGNYEYGPIESENYESGTAYANFFYVYFAVPESYLAKYGSVYGIHSDHYMADLKPMAAIGETSSSKLNGTTYTAEEALALFEGDGDFFLGDADDNWPLTTSTDLVDKSSIAAVAQVENYYSDLSSEELEAMVTDSSGNFDDSYLADGSSLEYVDLDYTVEDMTESVLDYESVWGGADTLTEIRSQIIYNLLFGSSSTEELSLRVLEKLDPAASDFASAYHLKDADATTIQSWAEQAEADSCQPWIYRFALDEEYKQAITYNAGSGLGWYYNKISETMSYGPVNDVATAGFVFETSAVIDFDIISLSFLGDEGAITTIGVVSSPISIYPSTDSPTEEPSGFDWSVIIGIAGLFLAVLGVYIVYRGIRWAFGSGEGK